MTSNYHNELTLLTFDDLSPNDYLCTVYAIGATGLTQKKYESFLLALDILEEYLKDEIKGIIPGEIGSEINALWVALQRKKLIIDSDMVGGRAVPEEQMDIYGILEKDPSPSIIVNDKGDVLILKKSHDLKILEQIYRAFAIASGGYCYIAGRPIKQKDAKVILPQGTISRSILAGEILLNGTSEQSIIQKFKSEFQSVLLVRGIIEDIVFTNEPGFISGMLKIRAEEQYQENPFELYYKNENIILIHNKKCICSVPDLISILDTISLMPLSNKFLRKGLRILVFGTPALNLWQSRNAISKLNPTHFGFDFEYKPISNELS